MHSPAPRRSPLPPHPALLDLRHVSRSQRSPTLPPVHVLRPSGPFPAASPEDVGGALVLAQASYAPGSFPAFLLSAIQLLRRPPLWIRASPPSILLPFTPPQPRNVPAHRSAPIEAEAFPRSLYVASAPTAAALRPRSCACWTHVVQSQRPRRTALQLRRAHRRGRGIYASGYHTDPSQCVL